MSWASITLHVIDFEGSRKSGVIEYGIVSLKEGAIVATSTRLCRPTGDILPAESRQHGLHTDALTQIAPFSEDFPAFRQLRQEGLLSAHNATVERSLLGDTWAHPGAVPDFTTHKPSQQADWGPWLDSCAIYRRLYPELPAHSLGFLTTAFSMEKELSALAERHCPQDRRKPHCALYDALAAALLWQRLACEPTIRTLTLRQVVRLSDPFANAHSDQPSLF